MSKRILILDNDRDPLSSTGGEFSYLQYRMLITYDSKNIIAIAKKFNPDLFVIDYHMAGHTSEDICRQVQWRREFGHIPTILSSSYFFDATDYLALGCDDIIFKPFTMDELAVKAGSLVLH